MDDGDWHVKSSSDLYAHQGRIVPRKRAEGDTLREERWKGRGKEGKWMGQRKRERRRQRRSVRKGKKRRLEGLDYLVVKTDTMLLSLHHQALRLENFLLSPKWANIYVLDALGTLR